MSPISFSKPVGPEIIIGLPTWKGTRGVSMILDKYEMF